jgi:transcriptional regulator with XRE-family HTH domain
VGIGERVREELARRRQSRQWLADSAKISISTLEKALVGSRPFTLATIVRIEQVLNITLREAETDAASSLTTSVSAILGAYTRSSVGWLEGRYLMLRPSAGEAGSVYAHMLTIQWDEARCALAFCESERTDTAYTQSGLVAVSSLSGHIYLVTNDLGQYRLIVLGRPLRGGELYGLLTSLQVGQGASLIPVSMPVAIVPHRDTALPATGRISPDHADFIRYRQHVDRVTDEGFALILR